MGRALWGLLRLVLLPLIVVGRSLKRLGTALCAPMLRRFDSSARLSRLISSLSSAMATQRGLLLLIGTAIVGLSLVTSVVVIATLVSSGQFHRSLYWLCLPAALLHLGVLLGFIGIMLAVPLGQSYKDR